MSDEEKKEYEEAKLYLTHTGLDDFNLEKYQSENRIWAIQIILNLIKKQSKEIEELKNKNKKLQDKASDLIKELIFENQELTSALLDSTPNDKIKAKIEPVLKQLERKMEEEYNKYGNSREYQDVVDAYNFLQSLLEKE